ncbi:Protein bric-a-brac 1-like protein [Dinothrombium tinctorium]|uniref:Protein bric-a-brac 1-like protein n=1 Tax=Dinothrombium tinctorium TaxID=1965070 RepID=A0A443QQ50_9ACAR|nr:Protein bric-a-brac 1-like protein [Dinothrombium tinctorium]
MVLAACSPFFQSLFMSNPCKHPIVILKDVRFVDLKAIIDFMYRGEVNVSQDQLSALLKTAETLKVKGLAEVTEKQARGQPQLQHALFGKSKKRKRNRNKSGLKPGESGESSESDDDTVNKLRASDIRPSPRLGVQRAQMEKEQGTTTSTGEQIEPSRILEQSMATAEVGGNENGQEGVIVASDVQDLADDEIALFEEGMGLSSGQTSDGTMLALPGPSSIMPQTPQDGKVHLFFSSARRLMMSEAQKRVLKDYLNKPIAYFDVFIDEWKKSIVWKYFGELAFKDPETGCASVIDNERHYCLKCIVESQERNPEEDFEKCNICFLSNGTATGNHKNHLRQRHHIVDDQQKIAARGAQRPRKKTSKVMTISLDDLVPVEET